MSDVLTKLTTFIKNKKNNISKLFSFNILNAIIFFNFLQFILSPVFITIFNITQINCIFITIFNITQINCIINTKSGIHSQHKGGIGFD